MINDILDKADAIKCISKYFLTFFLRLLIVFNFKQSTLERKLSFKTRRNEIFFQKRFFWNDYFLSILKDRLNDPFKEIPHIKNGNTLNSQKTNCSKKTLLEVKINCSIQWNNAIGLIFVNINFTKTIGVCAVKL